MRKEEDMFKKVIKEFFMVILTVFMILSVPAIIVNKTYNIIVWIIIISLFIIFVFVTFWKKIVDFYLSIKKDNNEKNNEAIKSEKLERESYQKTSFNIKDYRYHNAVVLILIGSYGYNAFIEKEPILKNYFLDSLILFIIIVITYILVSTLKRLFFDNKVIFQNNQLTDEYISILFVYLFYCILIAGFIKELESVTYYSLFIVLSLNVFLLAYKLLESTHYFRNTRMHSLSSISGLFSLLFLSIGLLFVQNMITYNYNVNSFGNIELNEYFDLLYYTIINITTVGFGRIYPVTYMAKIVAVETALLGFVVIYSIIAIFTTERDRQA